MFHFFYKKALFYAISVIFLLAFGYLLPIFLPFLLGIGLAIAAESTVTFLRSKLHVPTKIATAVGVTTMFALCLSAALLVLALLTRQLGKLYTILPEMESAMQQGMFALRSWLTGLASHLPEHLRNAANSLLANTFSDTTTLLGQLAAKLPAVAGTLLGGLSDGLLWLITGIISAYMFSVRLPEFRMFLQTKLPENWRSTYFPAIRSLRKGLVGWLWAEVKLAGIAFLFLLAGFFLLRIDNAFVWAMLITLVDAFPILGVGTVLIPWSIISLLQGNIPHGVGLLALYGAIWLTRSILEPKFIGKGLGLDPLITLIAIYAGWKLWGIGGMLFAPILTLTILQFSKHLQH